MKKSILMVCLGNICRSPVAEGIMRYKAEKYGLDLHIDSAGTSNYHIGQNPDERSAANAKQHGIDISKLKARQFQPQDFDRFDHIYVMDHSNYRDVIMMARHDSDRGKVNMILNVLYPESNMSVPDPYYGGEQGFENVFMLLDNACEVIASGLKENATR
jgi:protein-tyrosine phosphatase